MNIVVLAGGFALAFVSAMCLTPLVAKLALANNWVDLPGGKRTVHNRPTPRAGGIAIIATFVIGLCYFGLMGVELNLLSEDSTMLSWWALLLGGITIALTGLYDDAYGLGFKKKFLFQLFVAYAMYVAGFRVAVPDIPMLASDPYLQAALGLPLTLLWYLGVMNAINLIDGLDGLASGVSIIILSAITCVAVVVGDMSLVPFVLIACGALIGFLVYNFNPASIFLGDTGSLFLGFMIATFSLQGAGNVNPMLALLVMGLAVGYPIVDTALSFTRRFLQGKSPFAPDRDHIHHRVAKWMAPSVKKSVVVLYGIQATMCATAILIVLFPSYLPIFLALIGVMLTALLRRLGYLRIKRIATLLRRRISDQLGERVPRGAWSGDGASSSIPEPALAELHDARNQEVLRLRKLVQQLITLQEQKNIGQILNLREHKQSGSERTEEHSILAHSVE